ncbi:MAG TPA: T9SS type A sorting domain-containing protein, partial [Chitinophagaceae bacterium]
SIDGVIKGFTVSASPNPFRDHVTVNIESNSDESLSMLLINSEGKIISRKNVNINSGTSTYYFNDLQYLPAGIYFMSINRKNATNKMELVKQ